MSDMQKHIHDAYKISGQIREATAIIKANVEDVQISLCNGEEHKAWTFIRSIKKQSDLILSLL